MYIGCRASQRMLDTVSVRWKMLQCSIFSQCHWEFWGIEET